MTSPFQTQPQQPIKPRHSVLVFLKGMIAPCVLYVENPQEVYNEMLSYLKMPTTAKLIEKETQGPLKKVAFYSNQITAVGLQDEQFGMP